MARKLTDKLKEAFIERKLTDKLKEAFIFSYDECLIDSLMRIDEKETDLCKHCCYCNWSIGETTICKNTLDRKLRGVL